MIFASDCRHWKTSLLDSTLLCHDGASEIYMHKSWDYSSGNKAAGLLNSTPDVLLTAATALQSTSHACFAADS